MAYATPNDLSAFGRAGQALSGLDPSGVEAQLEAASKLADGYIANRVTLPLSAPYPIELVQAVCKIAAYELLGNRGLDPDTEQDLSKSRSESIAWLRDVQSRSANPAWADGASGASGYDDGGVVVPVLDEETGLSTVEAPTLRGI